MKKDMTMLWKKTNTDFESSAKVVDGNLILSLPDAINPVVWRMELGSVKASAMEVKKDAADGTFTLSLKTPKGEVHDIAPFETRELAVRALMRVSAAMQGAQGKLAPVSALHSQAPAPASTQTGNAPDGKTALKWLAALGGVLLVIFLFAYASALGPRGGDPQSANFDSSGQSSSENGVPQSADDVLRGY